MTQLVMGILPGGLITWFFTHLYYRKACTSVPDWAKPILEKLPDEPPSRERLLKLFQDALESGDVKPDPAVGCVACPQCGAPSTDFLHEAYGDDCRTIVVASCPHCGWTDHAEV